MMKRYWLGGWISEKVYFLGELTKDKKKYDIKRILDGIDMTKGGSWSLSTAEDSEYTIYFNKKQENQNYVTLSDEAYNILLVARHAANTNNFSLPSAIKKVETIKT